MKKAIRSAVLVLACCLLAVSCSKTASNTLALLGTWELFRVDETVNGQAKDPTYHEDEMYLEFHSGDEYIMTEMGRGGTATITKGRWYVDENTLTLTVAVGSPIVYHIEDTGFSRLVLSQTVTEKDVTTVFRYSFRYVSSY
jgi:hypothetical protein